MGAPLRLGCAVWSYREWLGELFPSGSRSSDFLRLYSERLTTVEGNTTFYATPTPETVVRWAAETPPSFRFCFKIPREISHSPQIAEQQAATTAFCERMAPLGERLGPFFLQLSPTYSPRRVADLRAWLAAWPADQHLALEVRHPDWFGPAGEALVGQLCAEFGLGRVIMDVRPIRTGPATPNDQLLSQALERKPDVPLSLVRGPGPTLIRYIGHPELERNEPFLTEWAARLATWHAEDHPIYLFMHCPDEARSPRLCRAIAAHLTRHQIDLGLDWMTDDPPPLAQMSLF